MNRIFGNIEYGWHKGSKYIITLFLYLFILVIVPYKVVPRLLSYADGSFTKTFVLLMVLIAFIVVLGMKNKNNIILLAIFTLPLIYIKIIQTRMSEIPRIAILLAFLYGFYKYKSKFITFLIDNRIFWLLLLVYTLPLIMGLAEGQDIALVRSAYIANICYVTLFFVSLCILIDSPKMLSRMSDVLIVLGVVNAALTVIQFFGGPKYFLYLHYFQYPYRYEALNFAGFYSGFGLFWGRHYNAVFSFIPLALLAYKDYRYKFPFLILIILGIVCTLTITAWVALIIFFMLWFSLSRDQRYRRFLTSVMLILLTLLIFSNYTGVISTRINFGNIIASRSIASIPNMPERIEMASVAYGAFLKRPFLGYGYTSFLRYAPFWRTISIEDNMFIDVLIKGGILGLIIWLSIFIIVFKEYKKIFRVLNHTKGDRIKTDIYAYFTFLILIFVYGITNFPLYNNLPYLAIPLSIPYIYLNIYKKFKIQEYKDLC